MRVSLLRSRILHRFAPRFAAALLLAALVPGGLAQQRQPRTRALGVVEVLPNDHARLVPVAIFDNNRFWDANLYHATPRPLALEDETLYDVLRTGKLVGTFTVTGAAEANGMWFGGGRVKPLEPEKGPSEVRLGGTGSRPSPDDEDKPPVLRRPGAGTGNDQQQQAAPHADEPTPSPSRAAEPARTSEDADRPTLKRGIPAAKADESFTVETPPAGAKKPPAPVIKETLTAISDPQPYDYRPFTFDLDANQRAKYTPALSALANERVTQFAATHATSGSPVAGPLRDVQLRAFDVDLSNEPVLVLTATRPGMPRGAHRGTDPRFDFFATIVARVNVDGDLRRLLVQVTDAAHMDAIPRLEMVDAVDAQGTGRGQLLFRQIFDNGRAFVLYRVGADQLWALIETLAAK